MDRPVNERPFEQQQELFDELCADLLDGTITNGRFEQLQRMMTSDVRFADRYVEWFRLHAGLDLELGANGLSPVEINRSVQKVAANRASRTRTGLKRLQRRDVEAPAVSETGAKSAFVLAAAASLLLAAWFVSNHGVAPVTQPSETKVAETRSPEGAAQERATSEDAVAPVASAQDKSPTQKDRDRGPRRTLRGVGVISQAAAAAWGDAAVATDVGARIPERRLQLVKGAVQVELVNGVSLIIQSPADFQITSPEQVVCHSGRIRAHVPAVAEAFEIVTPSYKVVDLGTEFALDVAADGSSECHVLDGEVEVYLPSREERMPVLLKQGESVLGRPDGSFDRDAPAADRVAVDAATLAEMASEYQSRRYEAWRKFSESFRHDPAMLTYFDFEDLVGWSRTLSCRAEGQPRSLDGAIVGCQVAQGRWHGKSALEFKRVNDRVRINVPGEFESLSLVAWIRVEAFERSLSSILLTDGHDLGEVHWQMTDYGALRLGVKAEPDHSHDFDSPGVVTPDALGRWLHLAAVYDGPAGRVTHFVNGEQVSSHKIAVPATLRIGAAEIGNWIPIPVPQQDLWQSIRNLNGRIDDFAILSRPLTQDEIAHMYELGKP